jgi:hypothetical protein
LKVQAPFPKAKRDFFLIFGLERNSSSLELKFAKGKNIFFKERSMATKRRKVPSSEKNDIFNMADWALMANGDN